MLAKLRKNYILDIRITLPIIAFRAACHYKIHHLPDVIPESEIIGVLLASQKNARVQVQYRVTHVVDENLPLT